MRESRTAQTSIFDFYVEHERGVFLHNLSALLDEHPELVLMENATQASQFNGCGLRADNYPSTLKAARL